MLLLSIFGLSSLLGASDSAATALGLGIIATVALVIVHALTAVLPRRLSPMARTIATVLIAGGTICTLELVVNAFWYELYKSLGTFLPLIVVACLVAARPEIEAIEWTPRQACVAAVRMGIGFLAITLALAIVRELVGHGSVFHNAAQLLGKWAAPLDHTFFRPDFGFVLAVLAPGAFIALGVLLAVYQWLRNLLRPEHG
jgi:electron transport complex protein RnfE